MVMGLGEDEGVHRRLENRVFHQDLLSTLGTGPGSRRGHKRKSVTELVMRPEVGYGENEWE